MELIKQKRKIVIVPTPLKVITFRWSGIPKGTLADFKCSICSDVLGNERNWGLAWVEDEGKEHAERLCNSCGLIAEKIADKVLVREQQEQSDE